MRTTLDIPEELLSEAMKVTGARTKTKVIKQALEDIIRKHKIQKIKTFRGKLELDLDLDMLRKRQ
ncbi:type II toxin-antitoxin system VapB family antitoxin [candidate division KSB1 bacterium]|nr:type II toxin-antitoxin system VapB family antitoxin [candidate division KSB1 bacterium]